MAPHDVSSVSWATENFKRVVTGRL